MQHSGDVKNRLWESELNAGPEQFQRLLLERIKQVSPDKNEGIFRDVTTVDSTTFQGSLNINGVEQRFSSFEEYEKARRRWFGANPVDGRFTMEQNRWEAPVFEMGGHRLQFSTPEQFKQLRRKMNQ